MKGTDALGKNGKKIMGILEKYKYVLLVLLAGVLMLMLPNFSETQKSGNSAQGSDPPSLAFDLEGLETKLSETLSRVEGAGQVQVVLTVKAGTRQILAQDVTTAEKDGATEKSTTTVVTSKGSAGQEAVPLQQVYPTFQGALVVTSGGDDPSICLKIMEAVSALTGLGADKISICKGK